MSHFVKINLEPLGKVLEIFFLQNPYYSLKIAPEPCRFPLKACY